MTLRYINNDLINIQNVYPVGLLDKWQLINVRWSYSGFLVKTGTGMSISMKNVEFKLKS